MPVDLADGESVEVKGSAAKPYIIKNAGGIFSCSCPAWRNQSTGVVRTCKHIRKLRGDAAEEERLKTVLSVPVVNNVKKEVPPLLLAETWDKSINPINYLLSEKLDGVRAYWNGKDFISRQGNIYHAPTWFKADMPPFELDGELFVGRKQFQKTVSIVRRQDQNYEGWRDITYFVFDAPKLPGDFETRFVDLKQKLRVNPAKYVKVLNHIRCEGLDHMYEELEAINAAGGEGLMLRDPKSLYEVGRSRTLLKVKSFLDDEATVIGYQAGKGRHKGRMGALLVKFRDKEFLIGTGFSDEERNNPPPIGSVLTFKYQELSTDGVPRFASFLRIKEDE